MKDIVWSKILSVGVEEIDEDHRKLVNLFNLLNHAVTEGESADYLAAILDELIKCTAWHFSHEERLMLMHRYAAIDEHKTEHEELIDTAKELQRQILRPGSAVDEEDIVLLERWLTEHIFTTDMRLGAFLARAL